MTNREWLNTMSDAEFAYYIIDSDEFKTIKHSYIDSVRGITEWLGEEKGSKDWMYENVPNEKLKECSVFPSRYCNIDNDCKECSDLKERKKQSRAMLCLAKKYGEVKRRGKTSVEYYDKQGHPVVYCFGYINKFTDELINTCENCRHNVKFAQEDLDKLIRESWK